ncbi:Uncharacterised protein [Mycobacterium tuberculosis]|uniref:Uncharacterized protein n=1 Tax=Mycobacterium tuberculosis TaxID=1773 RepID=A0A655AJF2_MYCTX|nr:Uncharacterised protein [Mycobacterium tuberculosis]CKR68332.1 Uncharacterised protein [Mycobacterium tuberculosis]CKT08888.1 Uncharacterised protein [Mycobacterium tuberculosis]CKU09109.1 Uncharacterised protein [Mycobacterium tuberculosis]CKU79166.1 Uncharacterised protein [Mycobacterium tuberculosis]
MPFSVSTPVTTTAWSDRGLPALSVSSTGWPQIISALMLTITACPLPRYCSRAAMPVATPVAVAWSSSVITASTP